MLRNVIFLLPYQSATINIDDSIIKRGDSQKLLGVAINSNFTFGEHINSPCQKSGQKISHCSEYHNINNYACRPCKMFVKYLILLNFVRASDGLHTNVSFF